MRKLVAEHAHAHVGLARVAIQLVAAGKGVDVGATQAEPARAVIVDLGLVESPLAGPQQSRVASRGLTVAGIEHKHLLQLAVAVPVVAAPVGLVQAVGLGHGLGNKLSHVVGAAKVHARPAIVGARFAHLHRAYHVKYQLELPAAHVVEIVAGTAGGATLAEARLVEHAVVERARACRVGGKCAVGKIGQHHRHVMRAAVSCPASCHALFRQGRAGGPAPLCPVLPELHRAGTRCNVLELACRALRGFVCHDARRHELVSPHTCIAIAAVGLPHHWHTVGRGGVVHPLVARHAHHEPGAVGLLHRAPAFLGRNGESREREQQHET